MAIKLPTGKYMCSICRREYPTPTHADACRDSHDTIYVAMSKGELNMLMLAIVSGDMSVLSTGFLERLEKYKRNAVTLDYFDNMR
jgi:hypothetical protein